MTRFYSSVAGEKELSTGIDSSTQTIPLNNVTGLPNLFPYTLILDHDTPSEEIINVTNAAGANLTADRGIDGTVGLAHEIGAKVVHAITARDLQESRDHEDASTDVHGVGVGNSVVGTKTVQTLEGKTVDGVTNTLQNIPQTAVTNLVTDQATQDGRLSTNEGNISSLTTQVTNHVNDNTGVHGVGEVLGRTEAVTVTNKTFDSSSSIPSAALSQLGVRAMDAGSRTFEFTGSNSTVTGNSGLAAGRFSGAPQVVAMISAISGVGTTSTGYRLDVTSVSTSQISFGLRRAATLSGSTTATVRWIAVELL